MIYTCKPPRTDVRPCAHPSKGARHLIQVLEGRLVVALLRPSILLAHADVGAHLKSLSSTALQGTEVCVLEVGQAVLVPFGYMAVGAAIADEIFTKSSARGRIAQQAAKAAKDQAEPCTYALRMILDKEKDTLQQAELAHVVGASYLSAYSWLPMGIRGNAEVSAWATALVAVTGGGASALLAEDS